MTQDPYRLLARHLPSTAVMMFDHDLRFVLADGPELEQNGTSPAQLEGKLLRDAVEPAFAALVEPNLRRALAGIRFQAELPFGDLIYLYTYEPVLDADGSVRYALVMGQNITPLRQAERDAVTSEARMRSMVHHAPAVVFVIGADRRFRLSEGLGLAHLGLQPGQVVGQRVDDVYAGQTVLLEALNRGLEGQDVVADVPVGDQIWETRYAPVRDANGQVTEVVGVASDVTQVRRAETAVRQAQRLQALGQLAGGVAHDFNNMLAVIMGAAEELASARIGTDATLCSAIMAAADRAGQLTRQLLVFSRRGIVSPDLVPVDATVSEAVLLLRRSIDRRVTVITHLDAGQACALIDLAQFQSALLNLGINARDAMPGGGEIRITTGRARLDATACAARGLPLEPGDYVEIAVSDSGVGIPREIIERVFDPFFTTKGVGKGTGLGLAAVHGAIHGAGGTVTVTSEAGLGATFRIYLPLAQERPAADAAMPPLAATGRGLILLVEDEPLVLLGIQRTLVALGYDVITAVDGVAGVERFRECHDRLAAVICDGIMPRMSGVDAIAAMRRVNPTIPMILCTGYAPEQLNPQETDAYEALITKPFLTQALAQTLARVLAARVTPA